MKVKQVEGKPYDELFLYTYLLDLRTSRQGWKCTVCARPCKLGRLMGWAALKGSYPPKIVFWDSFACRDLLARQNIFRRSYTTNVF